MKAVSLVDGAVGDPVLVFGSLPPEGRDLDLLVRDAEEASIADALEDAGFDRRGEQWVSFKGCSVEAIDLVPAASWGLPAGELSALYEEARPIGDFEHLVEPAPHHALLILARKIGSGSELTDKRKARLERALASDPSAWARAEERAAAWDARRSLRDLRDRFLSGDGSRGRHLTVPKLRPRILIALSGMDGSGKSTLASRLSEMLHTLGMPAEIVWNRLAVNPSLDVVAVPIKRLLRLLLRKRPAPVGESDADEIVEPGTELRARSRVLTQIWTCFVAVWNAASHRRSAEPHLLRGKAVICDRYVLDSIVNLRFDYGRGFRFRFQRRLIEWISPKPTLAFHLAVPAALAHERKPIKFTAEELAVYEELYEAERDPSIVRVDGARATEELCEEVARAIWKATTPD